MIATPLPWHGMPEEGGNHNVCRLNLSAPLRLPLHLFYNKILLIEKIHRFFCVFIRCSLNLFLQQLPASKQQPASDLISYTTHKTVAILLLQHKCYIMDFKYTFPAVCTVHQLYKEEIEERLSWLANVIFFLLCVRLNEKMPRKIK